MRLGKINTAQTKSRMTRSGSSFRGEQNQNLSNDLSFSMSEANFRREINSKKDFNQTLANQKSHAVEQFSRETERENGIIKDQRSNKKELS